MTGNCPCSAAIIPDGGSTSGYADGVNSTEAPIIAALGASSLTALASLGVVWFQDARRGRASGRDALRTAVLDLLTRSMTVATRAHSLGEMMKVRSGLIEGLDVAMHHRKPVDHLELHDWMAQDVAPLNEALSVLWTRWDQEGVRLANDVVGKCMDLLGASTAMQPTRSGWERINKWVSGERWTPEMREAHQLALKGLADSRKRLAEYARADLGYGAIDLFAQVGVSITNPDAIEAPSGE